MTYRKNRYSIFIRPISYFLDLVIIGVFALQFNFDTKTFIYYIGFVALGWLFLSLLSEFYEIYRFTKMTRIVSLSFIQVLLFALLVFSFFGIFQTDSYTFQSILGYIGKVFLAILLAKLAMHFLLRHYRKYLGGNYRTTIIIGNNNKTRQLHGFFTKNPIYGYQYKKSFDFKSADSEQEQAAILERCFDYIIEEEIDEIYCSLAELNPEQIKALVDFADNNLKVLKFIPDNNELYTKHLKLDYYGYLPVLSFRSIPIDEPINKFTKRFFDILLSIFIIVFVLSWLTPILAVIIKLSSPGPVFFRQLRNGLDYEEFYCYKFRSMKLNPEADIHQVSKNDVRVTGIGRFLRKTSIDELPQFFNVLMGNMSTVGPRPHMVSHTHMYADRVDKFMVRHFVKPGITGLAQVSGYRGEVETETDIINRVKYDIFYIENWSLFLDIKIILQTIIRAIKGDKKAY
ncbi:MAG TPA: undecaprenyl-phosphate glucose phosphotransferase [Flavobacteriaceae bacterium]|nr:undecaprenyl-phosphate glucose phosphotransferase [Flavobacteriaceae bacterium]